LSPRVTCRSLVTHETLNRHYRKDDGLISIDTAGVELKGDIVIKLYHLSSNLFGVPKQTEVSRLIFHTGFVPADQSVLSFTRKDLDGAYKDNRFPDDFELRLHYTVVNDPKEGETDDFWDEDLLKQFVQRVCTAVRSQHHAILLTCLLV
jgi:hypothetical protein